MFGSNVASNFDVVSFPNIEISGNLVYVAMYIKNNTILNILRDTLFKNKDFKIKY